MNQYEVNFWSKVTLGRQIKIENHLENTDIFQNANKDTQKYRTYLKMQKKKMDFLEGKDIFVRRKINRLLS